MKRTTRRGALTLGAGLLTASTVPRTAADHTASPATAPTVEFERTYSLPFFAAGWSVVAVADDGYALAGYVTGGPAVLLLRANADGSLRWVRTYEVMGDFAGDHYSESGEDFFVSLARTSDGGFVLSGPQFNAGDRRAWLLKTDANGAVDWTRTYGGEGGDDVLPTSMTTTMDGGYVLVGQRSHRATGDGGVWFLTTDADGTPVTERTYDDCSGVSGSPYDVVAVCDGYALAGVYSATVGSGGGGVLRVGDDGTPRWHRILDEESIAFAATPVGTDELLVASSTVYADPPTITLYRLDASGSVIATQAAGAGVAYDVLAVAGGSVLTGTTRDGPTRGFVAAVASNGTERWRVTFGAAMRDAARTSDGGYLVGGSGPTLAKLSAADATS